MEQSSTVKPEELRCRATTQVKVLSPETPVVPVAEAVLSAAGSILVTVMRGNANLAGSKSVARHQRVNIGTRETRHVLRWLSTVSTSPRKARLARRHGEESDKPIVVMKPGNAGGAKGLTGEPRNRDTLSGHGTGQRETTKLHSMTHSTEGEEVYLKSRMREICKSGSVRGLVVDAARWWPPALLDQARCQGAFCPAVALVSDGGCDRTTAPVGR
jgi:hypothetical protein